MYWAHNKIQNFIWHDIIFAAKYLKRTWGHCKTSIEGADTTCRSLEDVTFWEFPLAYLLDIKILLSYDPAIGSKCTLSNKKTNLPYSIFWRPAVHLTTNVFEQNIDNIYSPLNKALFGTFWVLIGQLLQSYCDSNNWPIGMQRVPNEALFNGLHIFSKIFCLTWYF